MIDLALPPANLPAPPAWPERFTYPPVERPAPSFAPSELQRLLDGEHAEIRARVKELLHDEFFAYLPDVTDLGTYRAKVLAWTRRIAAEGIGSLFMPKEVGGEENLPKFMAAFETLSFHDPSLVIKLGVQFGLFAGSIQRLGTGLHHRKYLPDAATAKLLGCFAMTEIGHGSNVQGIETLAVYDAASQEFVLESPSFTAGKNYIGNAAEHGRLATVFAQLETRGERHGVHAFVVPIRDEAGRLWPGVRIEDNGPKMGLNGVDNGRIWFHGVRVPREALLNRFADVAADGTYASPIASPGARFFTTIGTLVSGRISIAASANSVAKAGLTIAVRYGARRRQFGPAKGPETLLLDYPAHQRRLLPLLANAYAIDFAVKRLVTLNEEAKGVASRPVETLAAGLKAYATRNNLSTLQACREACGGEGYLAVNRFATLRDDTDVYTTFEGDNTVLLLLVAKNLLTERKERLGQLRPAQLAGLLMGEGVARWNARTPWGRPKAPRGVRVPDFRTCFLLRERSLLSDSGGRIRRLLTTERLDAAAAFTRLQGPLLELAQAHIERVIYDAFSEAVANVADRAVRAALQRLLELFAWAHLDDRRAWFLEAGAFTPAGSRAVHAAVERACLAVRADAVALVDAFGIPDALLGAPIAVEDGA